MKKKKLQTLLATQKAKNSKEIIEYTNLMTLKMD